ncbi:hypothetical protein [Streptomyces chartreusis]|uniref:hypothetical protein n=1 Tax=Streptomyces chartreusis TaxID=1969 RepID=UPI00378FD277
MPSWTSDILLAAITTLFIGLFVNPRIEARKPRIEAKSNRKRLAHEARAEFGKRVLTILSACGRLQGSDVPRSLAESRPALAARLEAERQRWVDQLDEATRYLVDNMEWFYLTYATDRARAMVGNFVVHGRAVVISERTIETKAERLTALTAPIHTLFFASRWHVAAIGGSFTEFEQALAALDEDLSDDPGAAPVPAPAAPQSTT